MPDLFKINRYINFYMNQFDFLEITFTYDVFSDYCTLTIYDKETYATYKGSFNTNYMFHIDDAIQMFLARRQYDLKRGAGNG